MGLFGGSSTDPATAASLRRIEQKLDLIITSLNLEAPAEDMSDVRALMQSGRKIEAIKLYRERTGAGLAEAKAAVEAGV